MLLAISIVVLTSMIGLGSYLTARCDRPLVESDGIQPSATTAPGSTPPPSGLLVPAAMLELEDTSVEAIMRALETATAPVAVEYRPVAAPEIARYRAVPVNATAQEAIVQVAKHLNPRGPTLYRVVLPKGAELVRAAGRDGFRGFSRTGGTTAHAVLKPVAAGGAAAAGWPVLAVAGTVMAIDMAARREQRAHQDRVEAVLGRQEERYYLDRVRGQRSADAQLSRAIGLLLDGRPAHMELAMKSARDEFNLAQQFATRFDGVLDGLKDDDGTVDQRRFERAFGGQAKDVDYFVREFHLSRAAVAIHRRALAADAAAASLNDPGNPYTAMRRFMENEVRQLEEVDSSLRHRPITLACRAAVNGYRTRTVGPTSTR